ncbi:nitroreductase [Hypnocyclicus thermotrophus]|uniref:Nitroreductase n=1 Tax=Hypnocyclicus thermotrophus TaxID=1627895 RepID=A0AA46DX19_9FUSO|nr:nitroreductase family protein [Hypnocyclicus thermotrophus]TDT67431.1 nitroreductase [Hypnocyclicus thermotrophus]
MNFNQLLKERRTIREFDKEYYIKDEELKEILEAATLAPSWANSQTWRFIILRDKNIISQIADTFSPNNPAIKCTKDSNLVLVACFEKNIAGISRRNEINYNIQSEWAMFDLGLSCENISLKIHDMGLGSVIIGAYDYNKAREILNIPENIELCAFISVGKPIKKTRIMPKRKNINEIIIKTL